MCGRPIAVKTAEGVERNAVFPLCAATTDWPENNLVHNAKDGATACPCNLCLASVCVHFSNVAAMFLQCLQCVSGINSRTPT